MAIIFLRAGIIMILLLIVMRLMGKRQIGEMQPYEFIVTLLIAEVACVPMSDVSIPLLYGIASIFAIFILHQALSLLEHAGPKAQKIINGKPSIVIDTDGVNVKELNKNNLDVQDLIENLRSTGYFSLENIKYAILESNGKLSVLTNDKEQNSDLPILIINNGKLNNSNLSVINLTDKNINNILKTYGCKNIKEVEVLTLTTKLQGYLKQKNKQFITFSPSSSLVKKENL